MSKALPLINQTLAYNLKGYCKRQTMKRFLMIFLAALSFSSCGSLANLPNLNTGITESEAALGIRDALDKGVSTGISFLGRENGFFGNEAYKLFLPQDAQKIVNTMRNLGMGGLVDRAVLQINRAAENAITYAAPIFSQAIREMTIADAINIIRGSGDAATQYFRQKTTNQLINAFTPAIKTSLESFSATKYYGDLINAYNSLPTTMNKLNPDLTSYVVGKAVDALFDQIGKQEMAIRANPVERTTEILRKVFGWVGAGK
jgi:hypothetical protein